MKSYSLDLREKIVETYQAGNISQRELASRFRVSLFFIVKLLGLHRRGKPLQAKRRGGRRKPMLSEPMRKFVRAAIEEENDLTLPELVERVEAEFGVRVSVATMCRALKQMDLSRKKRLSSLQSVNQSE